MPQPPRYSPQALDAFTKLLLSAFSTEEFLRFLRFSHGTAVLLDALPVGQVSRAEMFTQAVLGLERHALIEESLFTRLVRERSRRADEFWGVWTKLRESATAAEEQSPPPPGKAGGSSLAAEPRAGALVGEAPAKEGPWRWLHLSDLHVGSRGEVDWWQVLDRFWRSLDDWLKIAGAPDLILMTGDLTFSGEKAQFDRLTKFLDKLLSRLPKAVGGAPPLLVPVPGNHDLKRPAKPREYRLLRDIDKGHDDSDVAEFLKEIDTSDASFIAPLFNDYSDWVRDYVVPQAQRPGVEVHRSFFPGDLTVKLDTPGRRPLTIVGLNSAWTHYQGGDFMGRLALLREQFHGALPHDPGESPLEALQGRRALLLMHHPRSWLAPKFQRHFDSDIYVADRFVACLHGHMHEADSKVQAIAGSGTRCFYQAPSLFGVENYGTSSEVRSIGYTFGALHSDGELRAWPLAYVRKRSGAEVFDRDTEFEWDQTGNSVLLRAVDRR